MFKVKSGIYIITCLDNNKIYIGRSINWWKRLLKHKRELIKNVHCNKHLQNAVNKYGIENFTFELLEEYEPEFLPSMENYWCNLLQAHNRKYGYNIDPTSPFSGKLTNSIETREKISRSNKGRKLTQIQKENMSKYLTGIKMPKKWIEDKIKLHLGAKRSEKTKKKMSTNSKNKKAVMQYDLDGNFIKEWESGTEASKFYSCSRSAINKAAKINKIAIGFIWKYK